MSLIKDFFLFVVFGTLTGTCFSLLWMSVSVLLAKRDAKLLYRCLKVVMLFYVVPVTLSVFYFFYAFNNHAGDTFPANYERFLFEVTPLLSLAYRTIILVWFVVVVIFICVQIKHVWKWHTIRRGNIPEEDDNVIVLFEEVCERLQVGNRVELARNDMLPIPVISGLWHPVVILPCLEYTKEELEMIFTHELVHYRQKDLWIKMAALLIAGIHCFNPLAHHLLHSINRWSEVNCDIIVCNLLKDKYKAKEYYEMILSQMLGKKRAGFYIMSAMAEDSSEIKRRILQMKRYQKHHGYSKKKATVLLATFTVAGFIFALGASGLTADAQEKVYKATVVENPVSSPEAGSDVSVLSDAATTGLTRETLSADANVRDIQLDWNPNGRSMSVPLFWYVDCDTYVRSDPFELDAGDQVMISMSFDPSDLFMKVGLVYPDNSMYFTGGRGTVQYTFDIEEAGEYRIYMHNKSTTEIVEATGNIFFVTDNYEQGDAEGLSLDPEVEAEVQ